MNPEDVNELAALYALDALDEAQRHTVDKSLQSSSAFTQQVKDCESVLTALAYSAPPMPISKDLKDRLFQRLADEPDTTQSPLLSLLEQSIADLKKKAEGLTWTPMVEGSPAEMAVWQTDEILREVAFFVRTPVGCTFPNHAHASGEMVLVIEGDFVVDNRIYRAGDRVYSVANTSHQPATLEGCWLLCISSMDDEILN